MNSLSSSLVTDENAKAKKSITLLSLLLIRGTTHDNEQINDYKTAC